MILLKSKFKIMELEIKSFDWVKNAIDSSTNPFHLECCRNLIELFVAKFNNKELEGELLMILLERENQLNYF